MAEDDIYGNKRKYELFKKHYRQELINPTNKHRKYTCSNPDNLKYFEPLFKNFEVKDISYIRRNRLLQNMQVICNFTDKDLSLCDREDIDQIVIEMHKRFKSIHSKMDFIKHIRYLWKALFPEKDEKGRLDDTLIPYPVRHLSSKIDISKKRAPKDKLTFEEYERIVDFFSSDPRMQAYITLAFESLARPQELLYLKIGNIEMNDDYAKIFLNEHGKEGTGILQCIDSYPYLLKWLDAHPLRNDEEALLFVNLNENNRLMQLKPTNINKMLRIACKALKIRKPIRCYSLKRNGVTIRRLRGDSDMDIQHAARWTSTKQLKTYDFSNQDEALKRELAKRGIIKSANTITDTSSRKCPYCNALTGFKERICPKCRHPLDRDIILSGRNKDEEILRLQSTVSQMASQADTLKDQIMRELMQEILSGKLNVTKTS